MAKQVIAQIPAAPPTTIVIFGAMGDLAARLLAPALTNLAGAGLLDAATRIIGISHGAGDDAALRQHLAGLAKPGADFARLTKGIRYLRGEFGDAGLYRQLGALLAGNGLFYLATAPGFFAPITTHLGKAGLLDEGAGFRRVVIEKPFGHDLASARALNAKLLGVTGEAQLYRIDHFLGKETVQNILVTRFGNPMLEAVWNRRYIDHVQITAAETVAVGSRGAFYDETGALRDMVPNHLFQLLAMVGMEPPNDFGAEAIRGEKAKLLGAVRPVGARDAVRGQYRGGHAGGAAIPGYRQSADIGADSRTETYAALRCAVESWRWHGVPFYLRTGKALRARDTHIVLQFREPPRMLFAADAPFPPNRLVLQIQPDEGLALDFAVKRPGPLVAAAPATMHFAYAERFTLAGQTGYETLLYDALTGDQSLFQRADQIEAGWRAVAPLLKAWRRGEPEGYAAGSDGPAAAEALLARDGRAWHRLGRAEKDGAA